MHERCCIFCSFHGYFRFPQVLHRSIRNFQTLNVYHIHIFPFFRQVLDVVESWKEATRMAETSVTATLNEKKRKLTETIETKSIRLEAKREKWDATVITEMQDDIEQHNYSLGNINCLLSEEPGDTKSRQKLKQMQRRKAIKMFEEGRVKRREITNQGRPSLLDSDDEEFVAKSIEDKATYHGRRHDLVMYMNRRRGTFLTLQITNWHARIRK